MRARRASQHQCLAFPPVKPLGEQPMRRLVFGLVLLAACGTAAAQPPPGLPSARVQYAFPGGVKAGATVEITVTGTDVEEPEKLLFSHPGLKGVYIEPPKDMPDPKDPKKTVSAP